MAVGFSTKATSRAFYVAKIIFQPLMASFLSDTVILDEFNALLESSSAYLTYIP